MTTFRFSCYAAVSSDRQAEEEKESLPDQIKMARKAGNDQGGIETAGPFILDGYSRTGYVNLSDALEDIPPLRDALEADEKNLYDVLIVENDERLGDLAPMIATKFSQYRKQIHSARQSGPIQDPETYNPQHDESLNILMHVEGLIQGYRINKLRRGFSIGMPRRVQNGLTPSRVPYGYTKVDSKTPPEINPEEVAKLIQARDLLMAGESYRNISKALGVVPSRVPYVL